MIVSSPYEVDTPSYIVSRRVHPTSSYSNITPEKSIFQTFFLQKDIFCGYTLKLPHGGNFNVYPQNIV